MWILVAALPLGLLVGLLSGGDVSTVRDLKVRLWGSALPALAFSLVMWFDSEPPFEAFLLPISLVLFGVFIGANLHIVGLTVVGVGVVANLVPIVLNGSMPVRESAVIEAGIATAETVDLVELGAGRRFEQPDDLLMALGGIVPVDVLDEVLTFGDLIVTLGLINVGFRLARPRRRTPTEHELEEDGFVDLRDPPPAPQEDVPDFVRLGAASVQPIEDLPTTVKGSAYWDA